MSKTSQHLNNFLSSFRILQPETFGRIDYVIILIHLLSFTFLTASVFKVNETALFLRFDGLFHLEEAANQFYWRGPTSTLNMNFLKANGELASPNSFLMNPAMVIAQWAGQGTLIPWVAGTVAAIFFFLSAIVVGLCAGFSRSIALGGAWLSCLLTLPFFIPTLTYIRLWGNLVWLPGIACLLLSLGCLMQLGRLGRLGALLLSMCAFALLAYTAAWAPMVFAIGSPVVAAFFLVSIFMASNRRERQQTLFWGMGILIALAPFLAFVLELHAFSKVTFFRNDMYTLPMTIRDVSFFLHIFEEAGIFGVITFIGAISAAISVAIFSTDIIKRFTIGYLFFIFGLISIALIVANTSAEWWGPPLAYIDMVALPIHGLYIAILIRSLLQLIPYESFLPVRRLPNAYKILSSFQRSIFFSASCAIIPWVTLVIAIERAGGPSFLKHGPWPWPMKETPLVALLKREIGLYEGRPFRGRVVNLAGDHGAYPPFLNQHMFDHGLIHSTGNDHRNIGLWSHHIPTLTTATQFTSPFFHLILTRFLNKPRTRSFIAHEAATQFNHQWLASLGTRLVIHDEMTAEDATLRDRFEMGGHTLFLYEINEPNLGTYTPTTIHVAKDARSALEVMAGKNIDFQREAITHSHIPVDLVEGLSNGLQVFRDALKVEATSSGSSLLVLPVEYSHCLVIDFNTPHPEFLKVLRTNLNQTGILFRKTVSGYIRMRLGVFSNLGCRFDDLRDAQRLELQATADWWP